ncbi:hypothetical protein NHP22001_05410 [Helicobacter sp. NHP22-001]|nr:hypothetical protein NHP22001_05410 [Helicobacter sp. NHP22-001]
MGDTDDVVFIHHNTIRIPSHVGLVIVKIVLAIVGEHRFFAKLFVVITARDALFTRIDKTTHTHFIPHFKFACLCAHFLNHTRNFMTGDHRVDAVMPFAVGRVDVAVANPACLSRGGL